jgi:hypothetical protein
VYSTTHEARDNGRSLLAVEGVREIGAVTGGKVFQAAWVRRLHPLR